MADGSKNIILGTANKLKAINAPAGMPLEKLGKKCFYAEIDAIWPGEWVNEGRGFVLSATKPRIQHWNETINGMCSAGVQLGINLDHVGGAGNNQGFLVGSRIEGDTLYPLCQFIGEDAWNLAAKNYASLGIFPDGKTDGTGKHWPDAVLHLALTESPVVVGQKGFAQLLSNTTEKFEFLSFSKGPILMANTMLPCSDECMAGLCNMVPGFAGMSNDDKLAHLHGHIMAMKNGMARMSSEKETLSAQLMSATSTAAFKPLPGDMVNDVRDSASTYADLCKDAGAISPGVRDALYSYLAGTPESPNQICLSMNPRTNNRTAVEVFKILLSNKPQPSQGAETATQTYRRNPTSGQAEFTKPLCATEGLLSVTGAEVAKTAFQM